MLMPLEPEPGFTPGPPTRSTRPWPNAGPVHQLPEQPERRIVPDGFFERVVEFAREHRDPVVHDNAYSETTFDGYRAPSFLATPGAKEVGVEVFSLSRATT